MAKKEKNIEQEIMLDEEAINSTERVQVPIEHEHREPTTKVTRVSEERDNLVNCLRNEKVIVRFISRARGMITDPRHVLFGGMAAGSKIRITTPYLGQDYLLMSLQRMKRSSLSISLGLSQMHSVYITEITTSGVMLMSKV